MKTLHIFGLCNGRFVTGSYLEDSIDNVDHAREIFMSDFNASQQNVVQILSIFWGSYEPENIIYIQG